MFIKAIILVIIGSIIGWITNYIAIKMLFRPYKEINFGLFKIQGLIPKRKHEIGEKLAETIQTNLLSIKDIVKEIDSSKIESELESAIDMMLDKKLKSETLVKYFPMLALFLNESIIKQIRNFVKKTILENKDEIISKLLTAFENGVDLKKIIVEKVDEFSLEDLERITFQLAKKELKHIELVGAVLGGVIGAIQFVVTIVI